MGACLSSSSSSIITTTTTTTTTTNNVYLFHTATAKVIAMDGSLKEYSEPVKVYEALGLSRLSCFLCSSDELLYDSRIRALASQDSLHLGQLYFMLPRSKLDYTLTAADMATLAVKASSALPAATPPEKKRSRSHNRAIRIMPIAEVDEGKYHELKKITTFPSSLRTILVGRFSRSSMLGTIDEADE